MFKIDTILPVLAILFALVPVICPPGLQAAPRGLIRSSDYSQIYWVDRFGVSHNVSDTGMIPIYFKNDRIKEIAWDEWMKIPKGGPITAGTPPEFYNTSTTRINLRGTGIPKPFNATTTTSYRAVRTKPLVETKTVTTRSAGRITSKVLRNYRGPPEGRLHVEVTTPEVSQIGPARIPSVARQTTTVSGPVNNRRTVTTYGTPPLGQQNTTTTVTGPAGNSRSVTTFGTPPRDPRTMTRTVTGPAGNSRSVTTIGTPPLDRRSTTTTVTGPAGNSRSVTTIGTPPLDQRSTTTTVTSPGGNERTVTTYSK